MPVRPGRATPTTVIAVAFTMTRRPTTSGARSKNRAQAASLRTSTGGAAGVSSAGVKKRPSVGVTPSVSNVLPDNISADTRSPSRSARSTTLAGARAMRVAVAPVPSERSRNIGYENARPSSVRPLKAPGPSSWTSAAAAGTGRRRSTT